MGPPPDLHTYDEEEKCHTNLPTVDVTVESSSSAKSTWENTNKQE